MSQTALLDISDEPAAQPKSWAELGRQQELERANRGTETKKRPPGKPAYIVLKHGDKVMRRWELPKQQKPARDKSARAAHARAYDFGGDGSYFSADISGTASGELRPAPADMLLAPAVRTARDAAYAAAIAAGHTREIAAAAAAVAVKVIILRKPLNVALLMAAATASALADGYEPRVAQASGVRAGELFQNGFSAGSALCGGRAYAEAMNKGFSPSACDAASLASSVSADAAAEGDPELAAALARGETPPKIVAIATASGGAAAAAINSGASPLAAAVAGKAAAKAVTNGYSADAAAAAGASAATAIMAGRSEAAAMAAGDAAAVCINGGGTWAEATLAGAVASEAFDAGLGLAEALAKGARVAAGQEKFTLSIADANNTDLEELPLDIEASEVIHGGDRKEVEAEVEAYLDIALNKKEVTDMYKDPTRRGRNRKPAQTQPIEGGGAVREAVLAQPIDLGASKVKLEMAAEGLMSRAIELEETGGKGNVAGAKKQSSGGGCALM